MTTWRLLKRDDPGDLVSSIGDVGDTWREVGTHQSEHDWSIGFSAATEIGSTHGAGEYLLLANERYKELSIAERREFYTVEDDEPETVEAVSLKAVQPSAAEIMDREG